MAIKAKYHKNKKKDNTDKETAMIETHTYQFSVLSSQPRTWDSMTIWDGAISYKVFISANQWGIYGTINNLLSTSKELHTRYIHTSLWTVLLHDIQWKSHSQLYHKTNAKGNKQWICTKTKYKGVTRSFHQDAPWQTDNSHQKTQTELTILSSLQCI